MRLFSKKNSSPKTDIPADILADVSVNGEKTLNQGTNLASPNEPAAQSSSSTSPFLKPKTETRAPEGVEPTLKPAQPLPVQPTSPISFTTPTNTEAAKEIPKDIPKPFHFSDQSGVSPRVRFPDTAAPKAPASTPEASKPDFSQITQDKALTEKQKEHLAPLKSLKEDMPQKKGSFFSPANLVSLVVFILILGFISGGSWYYLNTRTTEEVTPEVSIGELQEIGTPEEKKSESTILVDQPNYLVLDIETVTGEQIKALLEAEKAKMIAEGITTPVEYLVVDSNNNPVAFSRFALLVGAANPNDLVTASLEPFSLYLVLDQGMLRMALAIALRPEVGANFLADKSVLPQTLKMFFYPAQYAQNDFSNMKFSESSYQGNSIFYANVDESTNYSIDMMQQEGILTVANSKNALRAVIDKRLLVPEK